MFADGGTVVVEGGLAGVGCPGCQFRFFRTPDNALVVPVLEIVRFEETDGAEVPVSVLEARPFAGVEPVAPACLVPEGHVLGVDVADLVHRTLGPVESVWRRIAPELGWPPLCRPPRVGLHEHAIAVAGIRMGIDERGAAGDRLGDDYVVCLAAVQLPEVEDRLAEVEAVRRFGVSHVSQILRADAVPQTGHTLFAHDAAVEAQLTLRLVGLVDFEEKITRLAGPVEGPTEAAAGVYQGIVDEELDAV